MKTLKSVLLICLLFITGCGTNNPKEIEGKGSQSIVFDNMIESKSENEEFTFKLISEKDIYKTNEVIKVSGEITYKGEEDTVSIAHAASPIWFYTTNLTEDYYFDPAMNEPLIITTLKKNEPLVEEYSFSGGNYYEGQAGEAYDESVWKSMTHLKFPPGQYKIEAKTDFTVQQSVHSGPVNLVGEIIFTVIE